MAKKSNKQTNKLIIIKSILKLIAKKSNKQTNKLIIIKSILKLIASYLGDSAIIFLKEWFIELKKLSIKDLKLIYSFFLLFH